MHLTFWLAVLLIGVTASTIAAIEEWRIYRRSGQREHLWGMAGSLAMGSLLASNLIG